MKFFSVVTLALFGVGNVTLHASPVCKAPSPVMRDTAASYSVFSPTSMCGYSQNEDTEAVGLVLPTADGRYCGACVRVAGATGSAIFRVYEYCTKAECGTIAAINLTPNAMQRVTGVRSGVRPVSFQIVDCGPRPNRMQFRVLNYIPRYFVHVQILNHRYLISRVEIRTRDGFMKGVQNKSNSFHVSGFLSDPLEIRIYDTNGGVTTDIVPNPSLLRVPQDGSRQMPVCSST